MKTSNKPRGTYEDFKKGPDHYKDFVFVFELPNRNPEGGTMVEGTTGRVIPFPLSVNIPMIGTTYDPKANKKRRIQFSPGEKSIFPDDWVDYKTVQRLKVQMNFSRGRKQIDGTDSDMLEFIMAWDINGTNPDRDVNKNIKFVLVDTSKIAAKSRETYKAKFNLLKWCDEADTDKIVAVGSVIFTAEQMRQNIEDIRYNLSLMAERDGNTLDRIIKDPKTERVFYVRKAVEKGILIVNSQTNSISWSDNPLAPLSVAIPGHDIVVDFVSKSFSGTGEQYYRAIESLLQPKQQTAPKVYIAEKNLELPPVVDALKVEDPILKQPISTTFQKAPELKAPETGISDAEIGELFDKGIAAGIIVAKGPAWKTYIVNGVQAVSGNSKINFVNKIKYMPEVLQSLKHDVEKLVTA